MADAKVTKKVTLNKNQTISLYKNKEKELQSITTRLREIENIIMEINKAENTLKELQKLKNKEKLMVNIGAGILLPCEVESNTDVKTMLPGSIIVDKKSKDVITDLEGRKKELNDAKQKLVNAYQKTAQTLQSISQALQKMAQSKKPNGAVPTNVN